MVFKKYVYYVSGPPNKKKKKGNSGPHVTKGRSVATDANLSKAGKGRVIVIVEAKFLESLFTVWAVLFVISDISDSNEVDWSTEDLNKLFDGMGAQIPKPDHVKFSTQTEKIDWNKVSFENHSPSECRLKWTDVMTKVSRHLVARLHFKLEATFPE